MSANNKKFVISHRTLIYPSLSINIAIKDKLIEKETLKFNLFYLSTNKS